MAWDFKLSFFNLRNILPEFTLSGWRVGFWRGCQVEHTKIAEEPILDAHFHQANARHAIPWQVVTADFNLY
jgi:hypothetical protein